MNNVEWIGTLPDTWKIIKVKNCFYISKEKAHIQNPVILSLARSGIKVRDISNNEGQLAASYDDYNPVIPGDLLLNPMDLYSGANCNVSNVAGVISPAYVNLRKKAELNSKFFDYYFKVQYWTMAMFAHGKGVSFDNRWTMNTETALNYYLPYPSLDIQNKIVSFLDDKCSKIDELMVLENQQVEKLKEYKQDIITETVTKGLDKTVELKESGVDWIGYIPKTWMINRLKFISTYNDESLNDNTDMDIEINYVDIGSVTLEGGIQKVESYKFKDAPSRARRITRKGDIIISTVRTYLKAIASINDDNFIVSTGFCVIRPNGIIENKYIEYFCKSNIFCEEVSKRSYGISYPAINASSLMNIEITIPSLCQQQQIVNFLDDKCSKIDSLIETKQQKIEKLTEYKKSLIYEYVTGKKEVK